MTLDNQDNTRTELVDGKFNSTNPILTAFPNYLANKDHPFLTIYRPSNSKHVNWMNSDSSDRYINNLKTKPADWKYRTKQVTYNLNSSGYRTHEWNNIDWKNSIVLLGCSNTFGIGLSEDETYAHMLATSLGRPVVNLGFPSGSTSTVLNNASSLICNFGMPWAVVINWPPLPRLRYYAHHDFFDIGHWTTNQDQLDDIDLFSIYFNMFADDSNTLAYSYYISQATRAMFEKHTRYITFSYLESSAHYTKADKYFTMIPTARDLIHPGIENSQQVTEYIVSRLK